MNLIEAKILLELPKKYTDEIIKKNYRRLILQFHPDKNKEPHANEKFAKINEAYKLLINENKIQNKGQNIIDDILHSFTTSFTNSNFKSFSTKINSKINSNFKCKYKLQTIYITPLEYLLGTTKSIEIDSDTSICCSKCLGTGYKNFNVCMDCIGNGIHFEKINKDIYIPKNTNLNEHLIFEDIKITIKLDDSKYFYNNKLCCYFDISLKESLIGFTKSFNDPFGTEHIITVNNTIIKTNDGYNTDNVILVFNIIYPEVISEETKNAIKQLNF